MLLFKKKPCNNHLSIMVLSITFMIAAFIVFTPKMETAAKEVKTKEEFVTCVNKHLLNRRTTIKIESRLKLFDAEIGQLLEMAKKLKNAKESSSGDYCIENIVSVHYDSEEDDTGLSHYLINVQYLDNLYECRYVSRISKKVVKKIIFKNDYHKAKYLANWIMNRISYDSRKQNYTAAKALQTGKGTCMAYAMLFQKLASDAGLESKAVRGYVGQDYHIWNIVKINKKYYHIDVCFMDSFSREDYFLFGNDFCNKKRIVCNGYDTSYVSRNNCRIKGEILFFDKKKQKQGDLPYKIFL